MYISLCLTSSCPTMLILLFCFFPNCVLALLFLTFIILTPFPLVCVPLVSIYAFTLFYLLPYHPVLPLARYFTLLVVLYFHCPHSICMASFSHCLYHIHMAFCTTFPVATSSSIFVSLQILETLFTAFSLCSSSSHHDISHMPPSLPPSPPHSYIVPCLFTPI